MKPVEIVTATQGEIEELLRLAKASFPAAQYDLLERMLATFTYVMMTLQNAKSSIRRLRQMLFGARTEHKRNVLAALAGIECADVAEAAGAALVLQAVEVVEAAGTADISARHSRPAAKPRVGHGRIGAGAYEGATLITLDNPDLHSGDCCPGCATGRLYASAPRTIVKVSGQPPLAATVYKLGRLRCRMCDAVYAAPMPAALAARPKYDASCASMLAVLRYGYGMPFYRIEALQRSLHVPLPDATQWDIVAAAAAAPRAAVQELIRQAAQAPLLHNDDTPMKVLSLMAERARAEAQGIEPAAKAINTSGIVAVLEPHDDAKPRRVVLFFTGHAHAGTNIERILEHRAQALPPPIQMCDALAANVAGECLTLVANCLAHGRRQVADVAEHFPAAARRLIEDLSQVYANDATCRKEAMSAAQRLTFHQEHSKPIMEGLKTWMVAQFAQRLVEPNSGLGKALNYLLRHWDKLTLFLRVAGAPLDNNICEQALKRAILHRKASMFYKTLKGAEIGDTYMSLIHTCGLCGVNPFEYLTALLEHAEAVCRHAAQWLPWNYRAQLAGAP